MCNCWCGSWQPYSSRWVWTRSSPRYSPGRSARRWGVRRRRVADWHSHRIYFCSGTGDHRADHRVRADASTVVNDIIESDAFQAVDDEFDVASVATTEVNRFVSDSSNITNLLGGILGVGSAIFNVGFSVLIVVVLTLYFLATLPSIKKWLYRLAPRSRRERIEYLSEKISGSVGHYVVGQTVVATLNGIVAYIAANFAELEYAALLAIFAAFMAFIPLVGAVTGGIVISLLALLAGWQAALIFAAIYFIYLQVEAYLISPKIMQRAVAIPGALAVIGVIAGGSLLGVLGALMAIPMVAGILVLVREVYVPYQDSR